MARKRLDDNEAAYLLALRERDPDGERFIPSWRLMGDAHARGADVGESPKAAFEAMQRLLSLGLVEKQPGRAHPMDNGYAINDAGKEALEQLHEEGRG